MDWILAKSYGAGKSIFFHFTDKVTHDHRMSVTHPSLPSRSKWLREDLNPGKHGPKVHAYNHDTKGKVMDSVMGRGRQRKDIRDIYKTVNHVDRLNLDVSCIYQNTENQLYFQTN